MEWVFLALLVGFVAFLVIGALTGRVEVRSCCTPADPRCDLRMRGAFEDEEPSAPR